MTTWTATVVKDEETGELVLQFSPESLAGLGWKVGDTLEWEELNNGTYRLTKKETE